MRFAIFLIMLLLPSLGQAAPILVRDASKLYVEAKTLTYDRTQDIVKAEGEAVLYYKHRTLQADHVVYNRTQGRVLASGHVKLVDEKGEATYASQADVTDDFASGFAQSVQAFPSNGARMSAAHIERTKGTISVLSKGIYTACEPCLTHPETPPLWQIRADEITEDQDAHRLYFHNAYFETMGYPIAYTPYFSTSDSTIQRQSGFLDPSFMVKNTLGFGAKIPYFWALAPDYDLTLSPSFYTLQGPLLDAEWRQRTDNGLYDVRLSGIDQMQPRQFLPKPYGARNDQERGAAESKGLFYLNDTWRLGWDATWLSDRFYFNDYRLRALDTNAYLFGDIVSQAYVRGQAARSSFDLSLYNFQPTNAFLDKRQDALAAPTFDYQRSFALDANHFGQPLGDVIVTLNARSVTRTEPIYQALGKDQLDPAYGLYQVCYTTNPVTGALLKPAYIPSRCLLRGLGGESARGTEQIAWEKKLIDLMGEVWQPFLFERSSFDAMSVDNGSFSYTSTAGSALLPAYAQPAFLGGASNASALTGMAGVGLEYRFPFVAQTPLGQQLIQPIGQIIARPNENVPKGQPNEDAQSLVFDDTNLFSWSKYSGFDRVEGGTRANYGLQYIDNLPSGGHFDILTGQSVQVAGVNSYTRPDAVNTGLESGLDKIWSNYVAGETLQPTLAPFTLGLKQQFDTSGFALDRFDAILSGAWGGFSGSFDYARYAAQPLIGYAFPREGLITKTAYAFDNGFSLSAGLTLDMSRRFYDENFRSPFYPAQYNVGVAYEANHCTTLKLAFNSSFVTPVSATPGVPSAPSTRDQTVLFELDFRTLGDLKGSGG